MIVLLLNWTFVVSFLRSSLDLHQIPERCRVADQPDDLASLFDRKVEWFAGWLPTFVERLQGQPGGDVKSV